MGFFRRLFNREPTPRLRLQDVEARLDTLELDVAHHDKQIKKIRGRLTGGIRHEDAPETAPETPQPPITEQPDEHARQIEAGRLVIEARRRRGLLQG